MHLRFTKKGLDIRFVRVLALLLVLASVALAQAQYQDRYIQQRQTRGCFVTAGRYVCVSPPVAGPYGAPAPFTFEPLERDRADTSPWPQELKAMEQPAVQRYQPEPIAHPDLPDQSELLKNSKDPDFILRNFKTMYIETRGIDLFGPELIAAELKKNKEFNQMHIDIVQDRKVADTVLSVSYNFAWDYPFVLRHQNTTTVLLGGKGEGPFSGPLGAWDVARQFTNAAKKWRAVPEQKASSEEKTQPEKK